MLQVALLASATTADVAKHAVLARDGFGNAVDWFFVYKLPAKTFHAKKMATGMNSRSAKELEFTSICDCPDPTCNDLLHRGDLQF